MASYTINNIIDTMSFDIERVRLILMALLILSFGTVVGIFLSHLVNILFVLLFLYSFIRFPIKLKYNFLYFNLIAILLLIFHAIITHTNFLLYGNLIAKIIFAVASFSIFGYDKRILSDKLLKILRFVAIYSFIHFFLVSLLPSSWFAPRIAENGGYYVRTIWYLINTSADTVILGIPIQRNCSLFWEPGVLQTVMVLLLYLELFVYNSGMKKVLLPILVIITTVSTTGYLLMFLLLFIKNAQLLRKSLFRGGLFFFVMLLSIPLLVFEIRKKIIIDAGDTSSFVLRLYDTLMPIGIASDNVLGIGYDPDKLQKYYANYSVTIFGGDTYIDRLSSNSISTGCAYWGFVIMILMLYIFYKQSIFPKKSLFLFIWIVIMCSEPLLYTYMSFFLFSTGIYNLSLKYRFIKRTF